MASPDVAGTTNTTENQENVEETVDRDLIEENVNDTLNKSSKKPHLMQSPSVCESYSEINSEIVIRPHPARLAQMLMAPSSPRSPKGYLRKTQSSNDLQKYKLGGSSPKYKRDNNMVLQLVVPVNNNHRHTTYDNYLTQHSMTDFPDNNGINDRTRLRPASINTLQGGYPSPELNGHINHGFVPDLPPRSPLTISSPHTPTHVAHPPDNPTLDEHKKRAFADVLTKTLSLSYALFNVTLGLALYVSDIVDGSHAGSEIFSLIMVAVAFAYVLYLTIDITVYNRRKQKLEKLLEKQMDDFEMKETPEGHFQFNVVLPKSLKKSMKHDYCFNKDRHSTNFFLKIGAVAFCFGHLIHSGLLLGYQIVFIMSDESHFYECASIYTLILDIVYPIYSFLLLFFIFKYSNVIINRHAVFAKFGIIHCLSASVCFWIWTICREILEAVASKQYKTDDEKESIFAPEIGIYSSLPQNRTKEIKRIMSIAPRRFTEFCGNDEGMGTLFRDISPYLYPFSVEFSILVVGIWYLIWQNIGICKAENEEEAATTECNNPPLDDDVTESNVTVHVDCHSSNKGLFGGFVVIVIVIINCSLYFIAVYASEKPGDGSLIDIITTLTLVCLMILTCLFGYRQITKLDLNTAHHNMLDDFLLFICIPAYFLNGIFSIIPYIVYNDALMGVTIVLEICQVLLQTVFIIDGVRRSSNTRQLRKTKPGRENLTFLVIANIAMWLLQTFEVKSSKVPDSRYDFYGKELWTILGHLCLPLMMFYRFHSAVCFGDIWKYAYEPSGH